MKVTIPAEQLQAAAARIAAVGNRRGDHIAITTADTRLVFAAAGDRLAVRTSVPASVNDPGTVLVPAPAFLKTAVHLTGAVTITDEDDRVTVADRTGTTSLAAVVGAVAPTVPAISGTVTATFPAGELARMTRPVDRAADEDTTRPLAGIRFDSHKGLLRLVATDARRLAVVSTDLPALDATPLVPATELVNALKALTADQDVTVTADDLRIRFSDGTTEVVVGLIQSAFPAWENLVKTTANATVTAAASELRSAVARVSAVVAAHEPVLLSGDEDLGLAVSATAADTGSAQVAVTGATVTGTGVRFGMNPKFILDALDHHDGDVTFTYQAPDKGIRVQVAETMWFLMPVRV